MIIGIDEVGRGAWAGPLVVGAVLLGGESIDGLTDSKLLSKKRREQLDILIRQQAVAIGIGWVSAKHIDEIGLSAALKLAARRAMAHIHTDYSEIIIDGTIALLDDPKVTLMKKADLLIPSVSAASIVAKVARDNYMKHLDAVFEGYKFTSHVGYGTAAHQAAIDLNGITPIHRLSFAPLTKYREAVVSMPTNNIMKKVTTKQIGDAAETVAAQYLVKNGHRIIDRNWKTKFCEIDIISHLDNTYYFTEVKYRKSNNQGGGVAAITTKKQRQMKFAAEYYALKFNLKESNLRLTAIDMTGTPPTVKDFLLLD
jgi:ribonuclease HII